MTPAWARGWDAPDLETLAPAGLAELLGIIPGPEFLLLGNGDRLRRPAPDFTGALVAQGVGVEPMDSRAAARAWGVLRAEDRWIVAALMPFEVKA